MAGAGNARRRAIEIRLEAISKHSPNYVAIGNAGFNGYIVFGFPNTDFFILESIHHDNATYVFGSDWEELSQLTKAEILNQNLFRHRLIHIERWRNDIEDLFPKQPDNL